MQRAPLTAPRAHHCAILRWILLLAVLSLPARLSAQWIGDSTAEGHTRRGIDDIYNMMFDSARAEFKEVVRTEPNHPAGYFFLAMIDWWRIVTDLDNTSYDDQFISKLDRVIELCDRRLERDENDLAALFFKGGALGFQGRLYGNREDWVKAANDGRQALPIVRKAYKLAPGNADILLGIGIYNYYAEVVPEQFPFVKPFMVFFPAGDKKKGVAQLREAAANARYANVEANYFLLQLLQNFEKRNDEALGIATMLHQRYPKNPLFHRYVGRSNAGLGRWNETAATYRDILARVQAHQPGYDTYTEREARYYLGLYDMSEGHQETALTNFYRADELSRSLDRKEQSGFMVMTNLRVGMIYDLQHKRDLAVMQYNKVLDMKDYQDAHEQARRYIQSPYSR